jgi:antitoxin component of RelBE/YafQ-DinJ toxin-antitoxin module
MFQLKKKYLDKISEEMKTTRSDAVNVCFEKINKEHIPFEPKDVVRLLQDIMEGIQNKRKKRERNCPISENDNSYRKGYLAFLSVVWMELGNDQTYC